MAFVLRDPEQLQKNFLEVAGELGLPNPAQGRYVAAASRVANTWATAPKSEQTKKVNKQTLTGRKVANGDIYYLPYHAGSITSMRLSGTNPDAKLFLTANLSGCRFFIDRVANSTDIVVSHANVANQGEEPEVNHQNEQTSRALEQLHTGMIATYAKEAIKLTNVSTLTKQTYYEAAKEAVDRKRGQKREKVEFWGGAAIVGFYVRGSWQYYYQTYGGVDYTRPDTLVDNLKDKLKGSSSGISNVVYEVQRVQQFWPQ